MVMTRSRVPHVVTDVIVRILPALKSQVSASLLLHSRLYCNVTSETNYRKLSIMKRLRHSPLLIVKIAATREIIWQLVTVPRLRGFDV